VFLDVLDQIRQGSCNREAEGVLRQRSSRDHVTNDDGIVHTMVMSRKSGVDLVNYQQLEKLPGEGQVYEAKDAANNNYNMKTLHDSCAARKRLTLKVGAQVMLLRNLSVEEGLCNGSRGVVTRFTKVSRQPEVRFANGLTRVIQPETWRLTVGKHELASRTQLPLTLGWAISVHKSQGMTLDRACVDLRDVFEFGQAYVALSRVKTLQGLHIKVRPHNSLTCTTTTRHRAHVTMPTRRAHIHHSPHRHRLHTQGFDRTKVKAHPKVKAFYARLEQGHEDDE
jgi:ATP-dependent DNA helicase PIF1